MQATTVSQPASQTGPARASGHLARKAEDLAETKHPGPVPFPPGSSMGGEREVQRSDLVSGNSEVHVREHPCPPRGSD